MSTTEPQFAKPTHKRRWLRFGLRMLLAVIVLFAVLYGWWTGRIRLQRPWDEEPSCIANVGTVHVYQWQPSPAYRSYRVMVNGKQQACGQGIPSDRLQFAVVDEDDRIQLQIAAGWGLQRVDVVRPKSVRRSSASAFPLRSLKVNGPVQVYQREESGGDPSGPVLKMEVLVE
jgi:hypothetical protein